jgi:phytoene dehydrogenase-like protein
MHEARDLPRACDVVVIGAGMGGLVSAALLARAGLEVCVLEAASKPGGYLAGFRRNGFSFDTAVHWLNQCGPGGMVRQIFDRIGDDAPATPPMHRIRRYRGSGFDYLLTSNPDDLREELARDFPEERKGLDAFFGAALKLGLAFERFGVNMRAAQTRTVVDSLCAALRMTVAGIPFMRFGGQPAEKGLGRFFNGAIRERMWRSETGIIACLMPVAWAYTGNYQRPPVGGSRRIASWLAEACGGTGAHVACGRRVAGIVLDGDRAAAVRYATNGDGALDEIRCRHVVAACDARIVYGDLLPRGVVSDRFRGRLERAETYDSAVSVFLGLSTPTTELGLGEEIVHITRTGIPRGEHTSADPAKTEINLLSPSASDPSVAGPGTGTLILHAPARIGHNDSWRTGPGLARTAAYYEHKQRFAEVLIERVERALGLDLRSRIEICEVATPVTYGRYTGNRDGAIMGFKPTLANLRARLARLVTPVPNVLLGSQWAEVGGGLPAAVAAGANAAAYVLKSELPREFAELCDVMDGRVAAP